jgi:sugar lactone lactonase YvrE
MQSSLVGSTPHGGLSKEQEPWVVLNSIAVDAAGTLYVGGLLRVGYDFTEGILTYKDGAYRSGRYAIPGIGSPSGIAVDGKGSIYAVQGSTVLRLDR